MVALPKPTTDGKSYITPNEYLAWERQAETKSEYREGVIVAMAGASPEHIAITGNIYGELYGQLKGRNCQVFGSDLRISVETCDAYYYPDVTVVCEPPQFLNLGAATLVNPTLLVEVLSDSTEIKDRNEKWECYQTLESLKTYVLVAQDRPRIEIYVRQTDGSWSYKEVKGLEATVKLDAIGCELRLSDVYARIVFSVPAESLTGQSG